MDNINYEKLFEEDFPYMYDDFKLIKTNYPHLLNNNIYNFYEITYTDLVNYKNAHDKYFKKVNYFCNNLICTYVLDDIIKNWVVIKIGQKVPYIGDDLYRENISNYTSCVIGLIILRSVNPLMLKKLGLLPFSYINPYIYMFNCIYGLDLLKINTKIQKLNKSDLISHFNMYYNSDVGYYYKKNTIRDENIYSIVYYIIFGVLDKNTKIIIKSDDVFVLLSKSKILLTFFIYFIIKENLCDRLFISQKFESSFKDIKINDIEYSIYFKHSYNQLILKELTESMIKYIKDNHSKINYI